MYIGAVLRLAAKVVENLESSIIKAMDTQPMGSKKREKNKLLSSLLVIVFFVLIVGGIYYYSSNSAKPAEKTREDVVLTLEPSTTTVKAGDTFTVNVNMDTKTETVSATELHINYEAATLQGVSFTKGTFLPVELTKASIGAGKASIILGSEPTTPQKGTGTVATLKFKAKSVGSTLVQFDPATKVAALGETANAVGAMNGATVVVQ